MAKVAALLAAAIAAALLMERWTRVPDDSEWWDEHVPVRDPRDSTDDAGDGVWMPGYPGFRQDRGPGTFTWTPEGGFVATPGGNAA